jgi:hypothetical protein
MEQAPTLLSRGEGWVIAFDGPLWPLLGYRVCGIVWLDPAQTAGRWNTAPLLSHVAHSHPHTPRVGQVDAFDMLWSENGPVAGSSDMSSVAEVGAGGHARASEHPCAPLGGCGPCPLPPAPPLPRPHQSITPTPSHTTGCVAAPGVLVLHHWRMPHSPRAVGDRGWRVWRPWRGHWGIGWRVP